MVTSIWPSRPTMPARGPSTGLMEFRRFERRGTTYRKYRMPTSGQVRGDFRILWVNPRAIHKNVDPSGRIIFTNE